MTMYESLEGTRGDRSTFQVLLGNDETIIRYRMTIGERNEPIDL